MAGDWIKMRGNLWDDPRVASLVDATDTSEAAVIGGLYWLWSTADQHTEDGCMPGLTLRQIDRKTGIPGFGAALVAVGWLADDPQGVVLANFTEHNGASAKRRATDAQRKANSRNMSASDADKPQTQDGQKAPELGAREREEKEKRETSPTLRAGDVAPATAGEACKAMKAAGLADVNPSNANLIELLGAGMTVPELVAAATDAVRQKRPFSWALACAAGRRRDAAAMVANLPPPRRPTAHTGLDRKDFTEGVRADGTLA